MFAVIECRGIIPKDRKGTGRSPFVEFWIMNVPDPKKKKDKHAPEPRIYKTTVKDQTNDPRWNEEFSLSAKKDTILFMKLNDW